MVPLTTLDKIKMIRTFSRLSFILFLFHSLVHAQDIPNNNTPDTAIIDAPPVFSISADDLETETENQDVSSLLQASRDVFTSLAGYNFSAARYRMRGLGAEHFMILMNGVPMNEPERGRPIWAFWGGLNDITRYPEITNGIGPAQQHFGALGGVSNINLRASKFRSGSRFSYALANRTYRNRAMLTHSTGMMDNNWAITISGSTRWSQEGYVEGTYYNGGSYFLSVEKKLNSKHSIGLAGLGAPTIQARQGIALLEAYELTGNIHYNPYWGYQNNGQDKRNARVRNNHRPSLFLSHYWTINDNQEITTTLYSTFGKTGNTNLNWYDAPDPRPDYYRYLPSYYSQESPVTANNLEQLWKTDPGTSQIDWDALYNANYKNLYSLENADGIDGNTVTFNRSKYIVENYREDPLRIGLNSNYSHAVDENTILSAGLNIDLHSSHNFKEMEDLLGGDYWVDVDQFAERDFSDPDIAQNNLEAPNQLIETGEVFGYNYRIHVHKEELFFQGEFKGAKLDYYGAGRVSHTSFWREGIWANGKFPNNSSGKSDPQQFFNFGVKGGGVYKISGRHFVNANVLYQTNAPYSANAYISPKTRDAVVPGLESRETYSGDISYVVRYPYLKARVTGFYSAVNNQTWARSFYHDEFRTFVNYMMTNVDHLFMGMEAGIEGTLASVLSISGAFSTGQFLYNSRPIATITRDNSDEIIAQGRTIYLKNYRIGGMPQTAMAIGLRYNAPQYWFAGTSFNYFTDIYLDPNPDRRTAEAVSSYITTDPQWEEMLGQTQLDNGYTLDAYIGKTFRFNDNLLRINASVNNLLNNQEFITGGYEQLRYDAGDIGKFPAKYGYMYGTTYFLMVSYLF